MLDKSGDGYITVSDILKVYDASKDKEFIAGKKTKE
jgi:hypothetical protein